MVKWSGLCCVLRRPPAPIAHTTNPNPNTNPHLHRPFPDDNPPPRSLASLLLLLPRQMLADALSPGIFDVAVRRSGYPYLEAEPSQLDDIKLQQVSQPRRR